jgi:hypothetical protein
MPQIPTGWFQGLRPWRVQGRALASLPFTRLPRAENGHEVYRARQKEKQTSVIVRSRRPVDRRSRLQRWHDAIAELVDLQAGYAAWLDALPESLRGTATAEALQAITDLDLDVVAAIEPPRGYGRD